MEQNSGLASDRKNKNIGPFTLLLIGDNLGSLTIWAVLEKDTFKKLIEIKNMSDSAISSIAWESTGKFLFIANITGHVDIIELTEFKVDKQKLYSEFVSLPIPNLTNNEMPKTNIKPINEEIANTPPPNGKKKKITPTMISAGLQPNSIYNSCSKKQEIDITSNINLSVPSTNEDNVQIALEAFGFPKNFNIVITSRQQITCIFNNLVIYSVRVRSGLKLLGYNNQYFAYQDNNNCLTCKTLMNTNVLLSVKSKELRFISIFQSHLLAVSEDYELCIYDLLVKKLIYNHQIPHSKYEFISAIFFYHEKHIIVEVIEKNPKIFVQSSLDVSCHVVECYYQFDFESQLYMKTDLTKDKLKVNFERLQHSGANDFYQKLFFLPNLLNYLQESNKDEMKEKLAINCSKLMDKELLMTQETWQGLSSGKTQTLYELFSILKSPEMLLQLYDYCYYHFYLCSGSHLKAFNVNNDFILSTEIKSLICSIQPK